MNIITVIVTMFTMVFLTRFLLGRFVKTEFFNKKIRLFLNVNPKNVANVSKNETYKESKFFLFIQLIVFYVSLAYSIYYFIFKKIYYNAFDSFHVAIKIYGGKNSFHCIR